MPGSTPAFSAASAPKPDAADGHRVKGLYFTLKPSLITPSPYGLSNRQFAPGHAHETIRRLHARRPQDPHPTWAGGRMLNTSATTISRRTLLAVGGALAAEALFPRTVAAAGADTPLTAAIIGHTGRGDYGHGMDVCFNDLPGVKVVGIADPDEAGRAKAAARCKAERQYADYREMLAKERPNLVSVAPRWSEHHREMSLAAIAAGSHLFMEKPISVSCAEADEIIAAAEKTNRKIAVAHQMRMAPAVTHLKKKIEVGLIGDLLQMNAFGKMDDRAGGEDLLVLGVHLFDLMRLFSGGEPQWCTARVLNQGRDITRADAHTIKEQIGPVAGDEIFATFAFRNGVNATFTSGARFERRLRLVGPGTGRRQGDSADPRGHLAKGDVSPDQAVDRCRPVRRMEAVGRRSRGQGDQDRAFHHLGKPATGDRSHSRDPGKPASRSAAPNAAKALEMVMAVYQAALAGARAVLPLNDHGHPLQG